MEIAVLLLLSILTAVGQGEQVYLSLRSTNITANDTEIRIIDIGSYDYSTLNCHTDLTDCCRDVDTGTVGMGEWYYPDRRLVLRYADAGRAGDPFYRIRNAPQVVRLVRMYNGANDNITGRYCCVIPTSRGEMTLCAILVGCPSLPPLANGSISYSDPTLGVGNVATYTCNPGYALTTAENTRNCLSSGFWSETPTEFECKDVCFDIQPPSNGYVEYTNGTPDSRPVGTVATYMCDYGYNRNGDGTTSCQDGPSWSAVSASCNPVSCGSPPVIPNGSHGTPNTTLFGGAVAYSCDTGYNLSGLAIIHCQGNRAWETVPKCTLVSCGSPPSISNGSLGTPTRTTVGGIATYTCDTGYELVGPAIVTCQKNGSWSTSPTCELSCGPPPLISNGTPGTPNNTTAGGMVNYSCDPGYIHEGSIQTLVITCLSEGNWGLLPSCHNPTVYLSLSSINYIFGIPEIPQSSVGEGSGSSLVCHTDLTTCCRQLDSKVEGGLGAWYYPNGSKVSTNSQSGVYVIREHMFITLNRKSSAEHPQSGVYCCVVPTSQGSQVSCANIASSTEPNSVACDSGVLGGLMTVICVLILILCFTIALMVWVVKSKNKQKMPATNELPLDNIDASGNPTYEQVAPPPETMGNYDYADNKAYRQNTLTEEDEYYGN